ncbi:MAG: MotA/TolQ/ExbB proton channel family protein [Candidatus Cloacimonetes bacterium]|nr:MotA/TolQ/ExbB proton channel family protein [Candidatus Cloacimonadota bacterium]
MRLSVYIGYLLGIAVIVITIATKEDTSYFIDPGALAITLGGTIAALLVHFSPKAFSSAFNSFSKLFTEKGFNARQMMESMVSLSRDARNNGIRSILNSSLVSENKFLEKALMLVADGENEELIEETLIQESITITERYTLGEQVFKTGGSIAPQFGMMGTIIGLIAMLNRVEDPASIPAAMGLALVTTLYGLVMSALFFKPAAGKIRIKNQIDTKVREIIIQGTLSIQKGDNPQITKEKLSIYLD